MHSILQTLQTLFIDYTTEAPSALLPSPHSPSALLRYAYSDPIPSQPDTET